MQILRPQIGICGFRRFQTKKTQLKNGNDEILGLWTAHLQVAYQTSESIDTINKQNKATCFNVRPGLNPLYGLRMHHPFHRSLSPFRLESRISKLWRFQDKEPDSKGNLYGVSRWMCAGTVEEEYNRRKEEEEGRKWEVFAQGLNVNNGVYRVFSGGWRF